MGFFVRFEGVKDSNSSLHVFPDYESMMKRLDDLKNMDWTKYWAVTIQPVIPGRPMKYPDS